MKSSTYRNNGYLAVDCPTPGCGQEVKVTRIAGRLLFECRGGCDDGVVAGGLDPQVYAELEGAAPGAQPYGPSPTTNAESVLTNFAGIVARPVLWAWQDRIALAKISALAGRPKIGKGLLYSHLIAQATRGALEGDLDGPRDVILVTTEDDPGDTLKPRLMAAGADLSRVSMFQMGSREEPVPFRVPQDSAELGRRVAERDAALVVLDPLMEFIDGKVDSHKSHPVRQAVASLNQIAREHGCAVLVVIHLNKGSSSDPLLRHEGSAAFTQVVRGGLMLGYDPDDPDGDEGNQRVLAVSASNLAALAPSLVYRIDTAHVVGDLGDDITTASVVHIGESTASGHDLLKSHDSDDNTATDEAAQFLEAELADGRRPADELTRQARKLGISETTLRRAKKDLEVVSERVGTPGIKGGGTWFWEARIKAVNGSEDASSDDPWSSKSSPLPERDSGGSTALRRSRSERDHVNPESADLTLPLDAAADRIREQVRTAPCSCFRPGDRLSDGRCGRCYGVHPEGVPS